MWAGSMNGHAKTLVTVVVLVKAIVELAIAIIRLRATATRKRDDGQGGE